MVNGSTVFCNGFISRFAVRVPVIRGTAGVVNRLIVAEQLVAACHDDQEPIASYGFYVLYLADASNGCWRQRNAMSLYLGRAQQRGFDICLRCAQRKVSRVDMQIFRYARRPGLVSRFTF